MVSTEPSNATTAAMAENNNESEVEILGVVHDDESGANVGIMTVDNQEVILIDVDDSGTFDYMASDLNNDGQFSTNELTDITDVNITISELIIVNREPINIYDSRFTVHESRGKNATKNNHT